MVADIGGLTRSLAWCNTMAEKYLTKAHLNEDNHADALERTIKQHVGNKISRKVFFKRMAALGYQQSDAQAMAESWEDD